MTSRLTKKIMLTYLPKAGKYHHVTVIPSFVGWPKHTFLQLLRNEGYLNQRRHTDMILSHSSGNGRLSVAGTDGYSTRATRANEHARVRHRFCVQINLTIICIARAYIRYV